MGIIPAGLSFIFCLRVGESLEMGPVACVIISPDFSRSVISAIIIFV